MYHVCMRQGQGLGLGNVHVRYIVSSLWGVRGTPLALSHIRRIGIIVGLRDYMHGIVDFRVSSDNCSFLSGYLAFVSHNHVEDYEDFDLPS